MMIAFIPGQMEFLQFFDILFPSCIIQYRERNYTQMEKWTKEQYSEYLKNKKQSEHDAMHLYMDINAKDLVDECEPGVKNLTPACQAMVDAMLEGDGFVVEPKVKSKVAGKLTIRYYVDNLHPDRRTYAEAMAAAQEQE